MGKINTEDLPHGPLRLLARLLFLASACEASLTSEDIAALGYLVLMALPENTKEA